MKKIFSVLSIISLILIIGCTQQQETKIPKGILSKEKMSALLVDIHLTEATISAQQTRGIDISPYTKQQYEILYKKYNLTQKQFEENISFYAKHIKILDEVYTTAIDSLNQKQSEPIK